MKIKEFVEVGYLQELNRNFLHPLGLALVVQADNDDYSLSHIQDFRDDLEGMIFDEVDQTKANYITKQVEERKPVREKALGYFIQPVKEE